MQKYLKIISPLFLILFIFFIYFFRSIPSQRIWQNYNLLYVPISVDEEKILTIFEECKLKDFVCKNNQFLPINVSKNSVEYSMFKLNYKNSQNEYLTKKNNYFFDKSQNYQIFYIPITQNEQFIKCQQVLNSKKIPFGTDDYSPFPFFLLILMILFAIFLLIFSKNKVLFLFSTFFPIFYLFSNPFFPLGVLVCFVLIILFLISNIWLRKNFIKSLLQKRFLILMIFLSVLLSFSCSVKSFICFILMIFSLCSYFYIYFSIQNFFVNRQVFTPVLIRPAKFINIFANKTKLILLFSCIFSIFLLFSSYFNSKGIFLSKDKNILVPSSSFFPEENLTQLEDFYRWTYDFQTFPYKSLNVNSQNEDFIEFTNFSIDENGFFTETTKTFEYNEDFKNLVFKNIDQLNFNSLESILKSEGENFIGGYSSFSSTKITFFSIIMMLLSFFLLLFLYIFTIIKKGTKK